MDVNVHVSVELGPQTLQLIGALTGGTQSAPSGKSDKAQGAGSDKIKIAKPDAENGKGNAEENTTSHTSDAVQAAARKAAKSGKTDAVRELIQSFGVEKSSQLKPEHFDEFMDKIAKL